MTKTAVADDDFNENEAAEKLEEMYLASRDSRGLLQQLPAVDLISKFEALNERRHQEILAKLNELISAVWASSYQKSQQPQQPFQTPYGNHPWITNTAPEVRYYNN